MKKLLRNSVLTVMVACVGFLGAVEKASAHATSIGFENAGPGAVTVWLGTYNHGGHHLEGSMQLTGVLGTVFGPVTSAFTILTATGAANKPAGLIDGVTNFWASGAVNGGAPLVNANCFLGVVTACNPSGFNLPSNHWQGVTFAGLAAGDYQFTYIPIANPSAEWTPWNQAMNGIFNLRGVIATPEPGMFALFGIGLLAMGIAGRRRRLRHSP